MKQPKITIGIWNRPVKGANGKPTKVKLHTVNFRCPETGRKRRLSFKTKAKAEAHREVLMAEFAGENYFNPTANPTVREVAGHWLEAKLGTIKPQTVKSYKCHLVPIVGPLLAGTPQERGLHAVTGNKPHRDDKLLLMLGDEKVSSLQTAQLRRWHGVVREECGAFTANRCMSFLKSILALAEEDFGVRTCKIPSNLPRRKHKPKKEILSPEEVAKLLAYAQNDKAKGIYYAFPFLTGVRVSEQLALLWEDIDFERGIISISKVQERSGETTGTTKTEAGERDIPLSATLRTMLLEWRLRCPRLGGELYRVFPGAGRSSTMASAACGRRWGASLQQLSSQILGTLSESRRCEARWPPFGPSFLRQHIAGAGRRGRTGCEACGPQQPRRHPWPLHASCAWWGRGAGNVR